MQRGKNMTLVGLTNIGLKRETFLWFRVQMKSCIKTKQNYLSALDSFRPIEQNWNKMLRQKVHSSIFVSARIFCFYVQRVLGHNVYPQKIHHDDNEHDVVGSNNTNVLVELCAPMLMSRRCSEWGAMTSQWLASSWSSAAAAAAVWTVSGQRQRLSHIFRLNTGICLYVHGSG